MAIPALEHVYEDGVCIMCGGNELEEYFQFSLNSDGTGYRFRMNSSARNKVRGVVTIPAEHDGLPVTEISNSAFSLFRNVTGVVIPDSVTTLGIGIFSGCKDLNVTISKSVTVTERRTFSGCSYESITVESGNPVFHSDNDCLIETASKRMIAGGKNSIIPSDGSVTVIGNSVPGFSISVFYEADFDELVIPEGVKMLTDYAFGRCNIGTLKISSSVNKITSSAFVGCAFENFTVADDNEFYESTGNCLIEKQTKTLMQGSATTVIPPDGRVTAILSSAFAGCNIVSVDVPEGVTQIGESAFAGCTNLVSATLPDSVRHIGRSVFYNTPLLNDKNNWEDGALYIGKHLISVEDDVTGEFVIKDGTLSIAGAAFESADVESVLIPDSVVYIGAEAFSYCHNLTSVTIPERVSEIGQRAFSYCQNLESVIFKDTEGWVRYNGNTGYLDIPADALKDGAAALELLEEEYWAEGAGFYIVSPYVWYKDISIA